MRSAHPRILRPPRPSRRRPDHDTLETIRKQGVIRLGYVDGAAPFSWASANGEPQGYSVDLCRVVVDSIAEQLEAQARSRCAG